MVATPARAAPPPRRPQGSAQARSRLDLEIDILGNMRLLAAARMFSPFVRQIQPIRDRQAGVMIANAISAFGRQHSPFLKVPSLRRNSSSSGLAAARIVLAGGVEGEARGIENTGQPRTRLANGAEFLRRAVRDAALEYQRLLEASEFELVPAGKHFGLDLIQPSHDIEHRDHRAAAVRPLDRELTAVNLVDTGGNVDPHRADFGQPLDRMVDDGLFIEPSVRKVSDRHLELGFILAG